MPELQVTVEHPRGDVKVIPSVLEKKYTDRGWKKVTSSKTSSTSSSKK